MPQATSEILSGLEQALRAESDGHHFYLMAAQATADPRGRQVFERLAQDELEHIRFLRAHYQSVAATGKLDAAAKLAQRQPLVGPIFSDAIRGRLAEAHFEMSALSIGIQLELSSEQLYRTMASTAAEPVVRGFYGELADWEATHYSVLLREQEGLKEDYWAAARFSPL